MPGYDILLSLNALICTFNADNRLRIISCCERDIEWNSQPLDWEATIDGTSCQ